MERVGAALSTSLGAARRAVQVPWRNPGDNAVPHVPRRPPTAEEVEDLRISELRTQLQEGLTMARFSSRRLQSVGRSAAARLRDQWANAGGAARWAGARAAAAALLADAREAGSGKGPADVQALAAVARVVYEQRREIVPILRAIVQLARGPEAKALARACKPHAAYGSVFLVSGAIALLQVLNSAVVLLGIYSRRHARKTLPKARERYAEVMSRLENDSPALYAAVLQFGEILARAVLPSRAIGKFAAYLVPLVVSSTLSALEATLRRRFPDANPHIPRNAAEMRSLILRLKGAVDRSELVHHMSKDVLL